MKLISARLLVPTAAFGLLLTASCLGRLGETEAQSLARYGKPTDELLGPTDKPVLEGAKELVYSYEGWRVRAAFLNNVTARIEYLRLPENGSIKTITEDQIKSILDAEKGTFAWREQKPRTGTKELNALKTFIDGRQWERSDHATAVLKANLLLVLSGHEVEAYDKKGAKPSKATPGATPSGPKF
jgi:hypothetical protein